MEPALQPGDCVNFDFFPNAITHYAPGEGKERRHVVDAAGNISVFRLGKFHVAGLTLKQAAEALKKEYKARELYRNIELELLPCP